MKGGGEGEEGGVQTMPYKQWYHAMFIWRGKPILSLLKSYQDTKTLWCLNVIKLHYQIHMCISGQSKFLQITFTLLTDYYVY